MLYNNASGAGEVVRYEAGYLQAVLRHLLKVRQVLVIVRAYEPMGYLEIPINLYLPALAIHARLCLPSLGIVRIAREVQVPYLGRYGET